MFLICGMYCTYYGLGTISLIIAKHTLFSIFGAIFYPILLVLKVPEAFEASKAIVLGFSDMFLPILLVLILKVIYSLCYCYCECFSTYIYVRS